MVKKLSLTSVLLLLALCVPLPADAGPQLKLIDVAKSLSPEQVRAKAFSSAVEPTILRIEVVDIVVYVADVPFEEVASVQAPLGQGPWPVVNVSLIGDIRKVNGHPVKGTWFFRGVPYVSSPDAEPGKGETIADVSRLAQTDHSFEFLQEDGTPIGTIFAFGLGFGPSAPGAPLVARESNEAIIGGTGAYLGMRGQVATDGSAAPRFTSAAEDPALRRQFGGGPTGWVFHLIPLFPPQTVSIPYGAGERVALFHEDGTLVTGANPASGGESLRLLATNIGPTVPGVDPGTPFPADPVNVANSPVVVRIGGERVSAEAWGIPGVVNLFEVKFTVPAALSRSTRARLEVAFVNGSSFGVPLD